MFWGLELEPGKTYKSTVEKSFHISMAALHPSKCTSDGFVTFMSCQLNTSFVVCSLHREKCTQVSLDLNFEKGDTIAFRTTGAQNKVYLTGYLLDENVDLDEMDSAESEEETLDPEVAKALKQPANGMKAKGKRALELAVHEDSSDDDEDEDEDDDDEEEEEELSLDEESSEEEEEPSPAKVPPPKVQVQKQKNKNLSPVVQTNGNTPKSNKKNKGQATPTTGTKGEKSQTPVKKVLEGGVIIEDKKVGSGTPAKPGKMVSVYYTGRLKENNKQFDATNQGPGFKFRLGKGEVIKGWDIGVNGMKIGGKRRIVIPPALAYGSKGSLPQIPANAPLVFDVELKSVS